MKKVLVWILSVVITLLAVVYQRATGPTYDKKTKVSVDGAEYNFKLKRSHGGESDCEIVLTVPDENISARLWFKRYSTNDVWTEVQMARNGNNLTASLPHQPPAGKIEYKIMLESGRQSYPLNKGKPVVVRFKGDVPAYILIPHVLFMFIAMFLSTVAGLMAVAKLKRYRFYGNITLLTLFIGGMILGPFVQWFAFGEFWAGVPFAWDLTDNKTLVAFLFWLLAWAMNRKKERPVYTVVAALVMLAVYSIPHSMFGSELNPETGKVIQGFISLYF
jgi:hypothetical protein